MLSGLLAAVAVAVAVGAGALYAGPVFRAALVADLGWSHELAAGAFAVGYLAAGATPILTGMVADRFGASRLLVAGLLLSALGLWGAALTSAPWHWYLAAGVGLAVAYYLIHVGGTLIATAGTARGSAVGVAIGLGVGLGPAAGPILGQIAIDAHGWRTALALFGAGVLAVALLVAWWTGRVVRSGLAASVERGASSHGERSSHRLERGADRTSDVERGDSRRRLMVGFFVGNALLAVFDEAVFQHGYSLGVARGLSGVESAQLLGFSSLALMLGMLFGGPLSDLVGRRQVLVGAATLVLMTLLGLARASSEALWVWGAIYGLGMGASIAVRSAAWGDAFAGPGRGRAIGIVASGYPVGAALTIWLGAAWLDAGGSHEALYLTAAIAAGLWAILGGALTTPASAGRRTPRRAELAPAEPAGA